MVVYLILYVLLLIGTTWFFSKNDSDEDFLLAGRKVSTGGLLLSKFAGAVGVSTFITYTGYAYTFGFGVFGLLIGAIVGYTFFAFWAAPRVNRLGRVGECSTQGELVSMVLKDKMSGQLTNWVTVVVQFFWILLSLVGGAKVIEEFGVLSYQWAVLLTSVVILIYVILSGLKAVIITDVIQSLIIVSFLGVIVYSLISSTETDVTSLDVESISLGKIVGLVIYGVLSVFGMADRYQLSLAAKNEKAVKVGLGLAIIPVLIISSMLIFVGLNVLASQKGLDEDLVFVYAMQNQLSTNLLPVLLVMFFAGLMSSADTNVFAVSAHVTKNFENKSDKRVSRITTVVVVIFASVVSLFWKNVIDVTIVGAAMRVVMAVPMIYILLDKKNVLRYKLSLVGGVLGLSIGLIVFGPDAKLAITTLVGTLLGLIFRSKK